MANVQNVFPGVTKPENGKNFFGGHNVVKTHNEATKKKKCTVEYFTTERSENSLDCFRVIDNLA